MAKPKPDQKPGLEVVSRPVSDAQQVEQWEISKLIEYVRNPRKNDHAVDRVASAIKEFGFRVPILAKSDGSVIDGHLRIKAARKLGMKTVPVLLADDMTETQVKAFRLSVNKMAELADWDEDLLKLELEELKDASFDLALAGFDEDELGTILTDASAGDGSGGQKPTMADKFLVPPFSVFSAREGWWQNRKRQWLSLGIKSELGRGGGGLTMAAEQVTTDGLNYYRERVASFKNQDKLNAFRRAGRKGQPATIPRGNEGTGPEGR